MTSRLNNKKFPRLVTSDRLFLIAVAAVRCTSHVATASPRQERHARDAWHEIRRHPPTRVEGDYLTFEHHHVRTNRETGEHYKLSYKLRRHRHLYVNLDDTRLNVQEVFCTPDELRIVVSTEFALADQLKLWTYPNSTMGRLVYGDRKWGCGANGTGSLEEPAPIFRSMTAPVIFNATTRTFEISTADASPFAFFGTGHMHYFSNETNIKDDFEDEDVSETLGRRNMASSLDSDGARGVHRRYGKFPEDGSKWGYGEGIEFNFNFDTSTQSAQTKRLRLETDQSNFESYCDDCYAYMAAGIGFEFQTETYLEDAWGPYVPSYLVYMRAWAEVQATYRFNAVAEATSAFNSNPDVTQQNFLLNGADGVQSNVNFIEAGIIPDLDLVGHDKAFKSLKLKNILVAGVTVQFGIKIPLFLSMKFESGASGRASKSSYYYAKEDHGIAYLNPSYSSECTMPYCAGLMSSGSCDDIGWCPISRYGYCCSYFCCGCCCYLRRQQQLPPLTHCLA